MTSPKKSKSAKATKAVVFEPNVSLVVGRKDYRKTRYESLALKAIIEQGAADYILSRPNHPFFMQMLQFVTERAHGKVPQEVKNQLEFPPAVALPAKEPEQLPDGPDYEVLDSAPAGAAQIPAKVNDGSSDHLDAPGGAADHLPVGE